MPPGQSRRRSSRRAGLNPSMPSSTTNRGRAGRGGRSRPPTSTNQDTSVSDSSSTSLVSESREELLTLIRQELCAFHTGQHPPVSSPAISVPPVVSPSSVVSPPSISVPSVSTQNVGINHQEGHTYVSDLVLSLMGIISGRYRYMEELICLERNHPPLPVIQWPRGPTPVRTHIFASYIHDHPDQMFVSYILNGLYYGFHIGFDRQCRLKQNWRNHPSSLEHSSVVSSRVLSEVESGCPVGPLPPSQANQVHVSPVGLVPKPHSNKWRMIVDLSAPDGFSVNDGLRGDLCSLTYASVDKAVELILHLGQGTQLVKMDLKDAYRMKPVHPQDQHLLGIRWQDQVYADRSLPFGLRSAPKIFTAFADAVTWAVHRRGVRFVLHYLDDFLFLGAPGSSEATTAIHLANEVFTNAGIPVATHKTEGPSTILAFLGILLDTELFQLRLPVEKLERLRDMVHVWQARKSCTRKDLESFVGHLAHAATVIRPGRIFLRSLFSLLSMASKPHHYIRLNSIVRADLQWWHCFLQHWNGSSFFLLPTPSIHIYSDASGSFGCGAFGPTTGSFQLQWPTHWSSIGIAIKELVPIVVAAALWGPSWEGHHIRFHSDNIAVVAILTKHTTRDPLLNHFLRCLFLYSAFYKFNYSAIHIPGALNTAADALSRNNFHTFSLLFPQVPLFSVPSVIQDLLIRIMPDWTSTDWTNLFAGSLVKGSHPAHLHLTSLV